MNKRTVEVFVAGCPCCEDAVQLVRSLACERCDVEIRDMRTDQVAQAKAKEYGIKHVPAVVINRQVAGCCGGSIEPEMLRALGLGSGG